MLYCFIGSPAWPESHDPNDSAMSPAQRSHRLLDRFGAASFHPTIGAAVDAYLADHAVDWQP